MTKLILSTSNIIGGGPSVIRRPTHEKSNTELTTSLRANFVSAQASSSPKASNATNGSDSKASPPSFRTWTRQDDDSLFVPKHDFEGSGLAEERSAYDITVKLFYLPRVDPERRCAQTREAVDLVLKELHVPSIDLLIVSFPGISFDADDEDSDTETELSAPNSPSPIDENGTAIPAGGSGAESGVGAEDISTMIRTWRTLEALYDSGVIRKLGLAEFGSARLSRFLAQTRIKPGVDQINVRDCCVVPKPLILFAKQEGIELLTHNDCTNILPRGTLRELLGGGEKGVGVLGGEEGLKGEVEPQWVVKYTAVVKDRGVVESKGYFAVAELRD